MNILKKYSYWIHSGKYTTIQKFSTLGMGIVSFMLLARVLGPSGFGIWGLFLVISSITETARAALIKNAFIRFTHQNDADKQADLQSAAFILGIAISLGLAALFFILSNAVSSWLNAPDLAIMLQWYSVTLIITAVFSHFEIILNANMDFRGVCWMYCIRQGLLGCLILICFLFHQNISFTILSVFYLVSVICGTVTGFIFSRSYLKWNFSAYGPWVKQLWSYGKFVFGNNVCSQLFRSTDNFVTSRYLGVSVAAYYNACLRISNLVDLPSQVLGDILFPRTAKLNSSDRNEIKKSFEKAVGASLIFSIPALIIILIIPGTILRILAGEKFIVAIPVLRITASFGFILPFLKQFGTIMDATGSPNTNFRVMFFALLLNIVFNLTGVYFFGVLGAALGTATTYFIIFIVTQIILYKRFGIQVLKVFEYTYSFYLEIISNSKFILKYFKSS